MNVFERFEKKYPFYLMDVNGFKYRLREAQGKESPEDEANETLWNVKSVSLENLKTVFAPHSSWDDLKNPDSDFVKFLVKECSHDDGKISVFKLRNLFMLWCEGDTTEKVVEFFNNLQDGTQDTIPANDKDFKPSMNEVYRMTTTMVFEHIRLGGGD